LLSASGLGPPHTAIFLVSLLQEGQAFEEAADLYVRRYILKGIPSLFSGESWFGVWA
jgi:hypothetical protein